MDYDRVDVPALVEATLALEEAGDINPLSNLNDDR